MPTYNGDFIQAEPDGSDDESFYTTNIGKILDLVRKMKPGDTITINRED